MSNLLDLYNKMIKAKNHYQHITTNQNFEIFYEIERQLFRELDNILLNDNNWIIFDDKFDKSIKCIKCILCDYHFICFDEKLIKYKKIIHQEFNCK